jgi:enoyl-CoA hydratase/carnithine racemase
VTPGQDELVCVDRAGRVGVVLMNRPKQLNAFERRAPDFEGR